MKELLIERVRQCPYLYDPNHPGYKNLTLKSETWKNIAIDLNETSETVKSKWKNLRDSYLKYKKFKCGNNGETIRKYKKWPWSDLMEFLDPTFTTQLAMPSSIKTEQQHIIDFNESIDATMPLIAETAIYPEISMYSETESPIPHHLHFQQQVQQQQQQQQHHHHHLQRTTSPSSSASVSSKQLAPSIASATIRKMASRRKRTINVDHDKMLLQCMMSNVRRQSYDAADHLFLSYAQTFKRFSPKMQVNIKLKIAQMFGDAELIQIQSASIARENQGHNGAGGHDNGSGNNGAFLAGRD